MKENDLFSSVKRSTISDDTVAVLVHNVRLLSKYVGVIVSDDKVMIIYNEIGFKETQINLSNCYCEIMETWNFFQY